MSIRTLIATCFSAAAIVCVGAGDAHATGLNLFTEANGGLGAWQLAVNNQFNSVDISGPISTCNNCNGNFDIVVVPSFVTPNGVTISQGNGFHRDLVGAVNGIDGGQPAIAWSTWSNGNKPFILDRFSNDDINSNFGPSTAVLELSSNIAAFGLEMQPSGRCQPAPVGCNGSPLGSFDMQMTLNFSDGSPSQQTDQILINSDSGAGFFGWTGAKNLASVTLTCNEDATSGCFGFGFGNMVEAVPEPASLPLFAGALLGFAFIARRRTLARNR